MVATVTDDASRLIETLKAKCNCAGGSAHFGFMHQIHELETQLDTRLKNVEQKDWASFARLSVSPRTLSLVNTLMQQFAEPCIPMSRCVLFCACNNCKAKLVKSVRAAAEAVNNPSLKGWVFELEQIDLICLSIQHLSQTTWDFLFDGKTAKTTGTVGNDGTFIWCQKWNQGCFDTAFFQNSTLVTLQFRVSKEHTFKPKCIRWLRDALLDNGLVVDKFTHVGVADVNDFQFDVESGQPGEKTSLNSQSVFAIRDLL